MPVTNKALKRSALIGVVVLGVLVGSAGSGLGATPLSAPQAAVQAGQVPPPAPGTVPGIQRWFLDIDKARVEFNDVLYRAEQDIAAGRGTANCAALARAADRIKLALPKLGVIAGGGAAIAAAYGPPMDQFAAVAAACVQGDVTTARTLLGNTTTGAIAAYGAAQETVDELLDGGA